MIDEALIESDEDGWHLILHGDFEMIGSRISGGLNLRLSEEAAAELVRQVGQIADHLAEGESVRQERVAAGGGSWEQHRRSVLDDVSACDVASAEFAADLHHQRGPSC